MADPEAYGFRASVRKPFLLADFQRALEQVTGRAATGDGPGRPVRSREA